MSEIKLTLDEWLEIMKSLSNKSELEKINKSLKKEHCAVDAFLEKEKLKPFYLRSSSCMIACMCTKCRIWC